MILSKNLLIVFSLLLIFLFISCDESTDNNTISQKCSARNLNLCKTELECKNSNGFWYNDTCNAEEYLDPSKLPKITIEDFEYNGAFRFKGGKFGNSSIDYAIGTVAYNPKNKSLFVVGHDHQSSIAEYAVVEPQIKDEVKDLPITEDPIQGFTDVLNQIDNPENLRRPTGLLVVNNSLIVNAEDWYDAPGDNKTTSLVIPNADKLGENIKGYYELTGAIHSGGYMGMIPNEWQTAFGSEYYTGWSSVYSIVSRYSVGPSLWTFNPINLVEGEFGDKGKVPATAFMNFPYGENMLDPDGLGYSSQGTDGPFPPASPLWNILSRGVFGFFVPNTSTFMVIGSSGGLEQGIGYKAVQENGNVCGGPCTYQVNDNYNYYWMFDINEILDAEEVYSPRPYAFGKWEQPHDKNGSHRIIGATVNNEDGILYVVLGGAGKVGAYDNPPLVLTYLLPKFEE